MALDRDAVQRPFIVHTVSSARVGPLALSAAEKRSGEFKLQVPDEIDIEIESPPGKWRYERKHVLIDAAREVVVVDVTLRLAAMNPFGARRRTRVALPDWLCQDKNVGRAWLELRRPNEPDWLRTASIDSCSVDVGPILEGAYHVLIFDAGKLLAIGKFNSFSSGVERPIFTEVRK